jgi:monofunctional biosynthetic peptidoglycan transglycosylase
MKNAASALIAGASIVLVTTILIVSYMYFSVDVNELNSHYPHVVVLEKGADYEMKPKAPHYWVRLDQISKMGKWAVILSEDWGFYDHDGVDFKQLQKAIEESVKEGKLVRGASTISQQVVKNVFLSSRRSVIRKVHEIILARKMEQYVPKHKILEVYFNIVELGPKIYGIRNASYHYFGKHPSALNPREAAFIAMLLPSPVKYSESFRRKKLSPFVQRRIRDILLKMKMAKLITEEERQLWLDSRFDWEQG